MDASASGDDARDGLFVRLSQNLTDLFTYLEQSQETLCGTVERLRKDKSSEALDEMEELIDGTFDEIMLRHKDLRKAVKALRSIVRLQRTDDNHITPPSTAFSSPVFVEPLPPASVVAASLQCLSPLLDDEPTPLSLLAVNRSRNLYNGSVCSSLNDRLIIDESADGDDDHEKLMIVKREASDVEPLSRSSVGTLRGSPPATATTTSSGNVPTVNQQPHSVVDMPSTSAACHWQRSSADIEALIHYEVPSLCHVMLQPFDAAELVDAETARLRRARLKRRRGPTSSGGDASMTALDRLVNSARRTMAADTLALTDKSPRLDAAAGPTVGSDSNDNDDYWSNADPRRRSERVQEAEKSKKMAENILADSLDDVQHRPLTRAMRMPAAASKHEVVTVRSDDEDDNDDDVSDEATESKRSAAGLSAKRNGSFSSASTKRKESKEDVVQLDDDESNAGDRNSSRNSAEQEEMKDEEHEEEEEIVLRRLSRRPLTRSRVKDEVDSPLRKKVTLLNDSDLDDDEAVPECVNKKASKITRKRVYSSSSSESAVVLDASDMDSGCSDDEASAQRTATAKKTRVGRTTKIDKKRSRVACDSDDERSLLGSSSETEALNESGKSSGKFRSRKMISKDKLAKTTVDAEKAEKERRQRLLDKQKEFNGIEMSGDVDEGEVEWTLTDKSVLAPALKALTLDKDEKSLPPQPVEVHPLLVQMLKPHQAEGIVFMYNSLFESIERLNADDTFGGILAHCMGLGKTFQVIAFLHTVMSHPKLAEVARHVMVVAPKNVVNNWEKEFQKWLSDVDESLDTIRVRNISNYTENRERLELLSGWHNAKKPSVLIISYELFRLLTESDEDKPKAPKKKKPRRKTKTELRLDKMKPQFRKYLQDPGPDVIICDEGHKLKSDETSVFRTMSKIRTTRRLCLTGTPLQNNLNEYYTMISFVKPRLLGTKSEFANRFSNIITRGQTVDATPLEVRAMKRRCHVLYDYLREVVQRRDYRVLVQTIPPKQEYVIYVRMTERQCALYRGFLRKYCDGAELTIRKRLLPDYHVFARIWTHPFSLVLHERDEERRRLFNEDAEFVVSDEEVEETEEEGDAKSTSSDGEVASSADRPSTSSKVMTGRRTTRQNPGLTQPQALGNADEEVISGWYSDLNLISKDDEFAFHLGNKLVLLQQIIKKCEEIGDKLLVFSQSLETLRIIRRMLEYLGSEGLWFVDGHEALRAEGEEWGWVNGIDYLVIDGSVGTKNRDFHQDQFNDPLNLRTRLMLISTLAGSLGTNLVTANRVVIFDACWNPSHDTQAMFRVYRYGQMKPVYIYRLIAQGTMEERIYKRQVTKESTARRVTEEAQIQRHFRGSDLYELYEFDPVMEDPNADNQARLAPAKDRLLADVILSHGSAIVSYLQHDSLFDEVEDEKLNESERLAAWEDYEREKKAGPLAYVTPGMAAFQMNGAAVAAAAAAGAGTYQNTGMHQNTGGLFPIIPLTLPPHLVILPSNAPELVNITAGARSDVLYKTCFAVPAMSHDVAIRVLFIRRLLDRLMPNIPHDRRGGINEFNSYFINIIRDSVNKQHAPVQLLERAVNVFRTTVGIVRDVPKCMELIVIFNRLAPALFPTPQVTL